LWEARPAQALAQSAGLALEQLVLDQEPEPFLEAQVPSRGAGELLLKAGGHAAQAQLMELL
jgi:hypothetical protein